MLLLSTFFSCCVSFFFFFNDTATTEIYTLSLHDALPISRCTRRSCASRYATSCATVMNVSPWCFAKLSRSGWRAIERSEEHTSELQSQFHLVCRLLLEKKKKQKKRKKK